MGHAHGVGTDPGFHQALQLAMDHWRSMRELPVEEEPAPTDDADAGAHAELRRRAE